MRLRLVDTTRRKIRDEAAKQGTFVADTQRDSLTICYSIKSYSSESPFDSLLGILFVPIVPLSGTVSFLNRLATAPPIWRVIWNLVELCFCEEDNALKHSVARWV